MALGALGASAAHAAPAAVTLKGLPPAAPAAEQPAPPAKPATAPSALQFGDFTITVGADGAGTESAPAYQITVEREGLPLSRLTAPYHGTLSKHFVADLNRDGGFEVVVTFTDNGGADTQVRVFSWKSDLLQPIRVSGLADAQQTGYHGGDEFAVADGKLLRVFQVYERQNETWVPTAGKRKFRYAFDEGRWVGE